MTIEQCGICRQFMWETSHVCPPSWLVWCPDHGTSEDDAEVIYARSAEDAAEGWAEQDDHNSAEYMIARGDTTAVVFVQKRALGAVPQAFRVSGEYVASYQAAELPASR